MFYDSLIFLTTWTRRGRVAFFSLFLRANVKIRALDSPLLSPCELPFGIFRDEILIPHIWIRLYLPLLSILVGYY